MRKRYYLLLIAAAFVCYSILIEPYWIELKSYDISVRGLSGKEITVVHLGDIHTTRLGSREVRTLRMVERINPDYVFLAGDLLKSRSNIRAGLDFIAGLKAKHGVFIVPGNADGVLVNAIKDSAIPKVSPDYRVLTNESVDCGDFTLVGIDDPVQCRDDMKEAFAGVDQSRPVFLLIHFHANRVLKQIDGLRVDLIFSAHTHGGQIGLVPLVDLIPYARRSRYLAGLYTVDGTTLHVTKGVGTNLFPMRFLCRPEIAVFHLRGN